MIESVKLLNFVSHGDTTLELEDGVNVFVGANGAGKSSIIDGITYALYGKHARDSDRDILRRGSLEGLVAVTFEAGGKQLLAERKFGKGGKLESAVLRELSPSPRLIVAGERKQYGESMSAEIAKILELDYEKMEVATIVHQGELDKIIRYQPKEMKELINSLIGIDRLDLAFANMKEAVDGFRSRLRAECMNFDDRDLEKLKLQIKDATVRHEDAQSRIKSVQTELAIINEEERKLLSALAILEPLRTKKTEFDQRMEDLLSYARKKRNEFESKSKEMAKTILKASGCLAIVSQKSVIETEKTRLESENDELHLERTTITADLRAIRTAGKEVARLEKEVRECAIKVQECAKKITRAKSDLGELEGVKKPTDETSEQIKKRKRELEATERLQRETLAEIGQKLKDYDLIKKEGVCPTCDSTLEEINLSAKLASRHKEHSEVGSKHERVLEELESLDALSEKRRQYDEAQKKLPRAKDQLDEYHDDLKSEKKRMTGLRVDLKSKVKEAKNIPLLEAKLKGNQARMLTSEQDRIKHRNKEIALIEAEGWLRDNDVRAADDISKLEGEKQLLDAKLEALPAEPFHTQLERFSLDEYSSDLVKKVIALEREAKDYDADGYQTAKNRLEKDVRPNIARKTTDLGGLCQSESDAGDQLEKLCMASETVGKAIPYIRIFERVKNDVYNRDGVLATSLRSWAVKELSRNASDYIRMFGIGLSEIQLKEEKREVRIECYSGSGTNEVGSMSGGEKVAIALALRFAMAKLMGKGRVDFIALDEPTAHLDEERRRSLVRLVTEFSATPNSPLKQIIIITHDREIFEDSEVSAMFQFEKGIGGISKVIKS